MDIVARLKLFMATQQIANSQFADTCQIPRPTISQILNGRNKKISDEIIGKIHEAYPELSVLWLMFGEGSMMTDGNIQISEAKNAAKTPHKNREAAVNEQNKDQLTFDVFNTDSDSENFSRPSMTQIGASAAASSQASPALSDSKTGAMTINPDMSKKIQSIMVFYNDNSFESFLPSEKK